ncbi:MAG: lipopolysaccharide biosynthesis protein [Leptolyngbyaceae cyanobacterium]
MLVEKLKSRLSSKFVRNASWLGLAELLNRIFRLGTTVVLARMFSPYEYGLIAIIYTVHSFAEVFTSKVGIGAKIVQTEKQSLNAVCNTAYWFSWILCSSMFLLQCLAAIPVAWIYEDNQLILPICIVGLKYLVLPIFKVQSALLKRENKLKVHAISNAASSLVSNAITVLLALFGLGVWAIVWAMLLSTVVRAIIYNTQYAWKPPRQFQLEHWQDVAGFGSSMLGVGLLDRLRLNLDYLIVGHFLGVEALGLYFFAFNAGIGISQNVINAFISSLFPYLCEVRENVQKFQARYLGSLKTIALVVIPLVTLQASLAPFYVPVVFGEKWLAAVPILSIICLSAIPMAFALAAYQLLNAADKIRITLIWNAFYTILFAIAILVAVQWGILWVAVAVLLCQGLTLIFSIWSAQYVFHKVYAR